MSESGPYLLSRLTAKSYTAATSFPARATDLGIVPNRPLCAGFVIRTRVRALPSFCLLNSASASETTLGGSGKRSSGFSPK